MSSKVSNALVPYSKRLLSGHFREQYFIQFTDQALTLSAFIKNRSLFSYSLGPCTFHCLKDIGVVKERGLNFSVAFFLPVSYTVASRLCSFQLLTHLPLEKPIIRVIVLLRGNVLANILLMYSHVAHYME